MPADHLLIVVGIDSDSRVGNGELHLDCSSSGRDSMGVDIAEVLGCIVAHGRTLGLFWGFGSLKSVAFW